MIENAKVQKTVEQGPTNEKLDNVSLTKGEFEDAIQDFLKNSPTHDAVRASLQAMRPLTSPNYPHIVNNDPSRADALRDKACAKIDELLQQNQRRPVFSPEEAATLSRLNDTLKKAPVAMLHSDTLMVRQLEPITRMLQNKI